MRKVVTAPQDYTGGEQVGLRQHKLDSGDIGRRLYRGGTGRAKTTPVNASFFTGAIIQGGNR